MISNKIIPQIKKNLKGFPFLLFLYFMSTGITFAANINTNRYIGLNHIENYTSKLPFQNWCITQDNRGIIYVGNQAGLQEFDGKNWRVIDIPNYRVSSLAVDKNGNIFMGGVNELGFFNKDSYGRLKYNSLMEHLSYAHRKFSCVWQIISIKDHIFFRTSKYLFSWNIKRKEMKTWVAETTFYSSFYCNGKIFIQQKDIGLMQLTNGLLHPLPGSKKFANELIYLMVHTNPQQVLILTQNNGFCSYSFKDYQIKHFPTKIEKYLKEKILYHCTQLTNGDFALATLQGGLIIIDSFGKIKKIFNKESGVQDNCVNYVFEDSQENLWLALDNGISKIENTSPILVYNDNRSNLPGLVLSVVRHGSNSNLFVGTTRGLYALESPLSTRFRQIPGISRTCFSSLSIDDSLLVATELGVYQIKGLKVIKKINKRYSLFLHHSKKNLNRVWVGTAKGLVSLISKSTPQSSQLHNWQEEHYFSDISDQIRTIVEDLEGNLWLGIKSKGVLRVSFPNSHKIINPVVTQYDSSHGLPPEVIHVYWAAGHVIFSSEKGIFRFDKKYNRFIPDTTLGKIFSNGSRNVWRISEDRANNIWFNSKNKNYQAILQPTGQYKIIKKPLLKISGPQVNAIYPDPNGKIIWFARNDSLIYYNSKVTKNYQLDFNTIIREVIINGHPTFYDKEKGKYQLSEKLNNQIPIIPYKNRNIRFEFVATFFEDEAATKYQCFLEGYDKAWSPWSSESHMPYTNLDGGFYTFRVRAKNIFENISEQAQFQFRILSPWYLTWWAKLVYIFFALTLIFLVVKWRSWKLIQEKQRLEQVVKERTKEINQKNLQLQAQSEQLKELDNAKSNFFANISHEFRTPLTLIMGPLEQILSTCQDNEQKRKVKLMLRNAERLLFLINQLLDLSKLESGRMKLNTVCKNIVPFIKGIVDSFTIAAHQHEVDLILHLEKDCITLYYDPEKLENIISNLLINAIKFTPPGGKIKVTVTMVSNHFLKLSIRDTGRGIPHDQLEFIFDRFFQVENSSKENRLKGTGIGLALTKELVNLHHGNIDVHTRRGENSGTEFIIQLPMGKNHLKPEEINGATINSHEEQKIIRNKKSTAFLLEDETKKTDFQEFTHLDENSIILVIEDSTDIREYIKGTLESEFKVIEAENGEQGIAKAKESIPDLIISDVMMPGINGYEVCQTLKKETLTSHIPIILLTAKAAEENILQGLETGADDYITKPFSTKILCARIKNLIELRRQLQQNLKREMIFQPVKTSISEIDRDFLDDLNKVIEKNLSDSDFNVEQLAKKLYMSRATIYRKLIGLIGETPTEYIKSYRLKRGAELLKNKFGSVLEVALEVGFSSSAYFTKCFKDKFHQLPSNYL